MLNIQLRSAIEKDAAMILKWANDPLTRKMSFNTSPISLTEHDKWFSLQLKSSKSRLFVAMYKSLIPFGILRFHLIRSQVWEVGINLDPEFRRRKFGTEILSAGCKIMEKQYPACIILAHTRPENKPFRCIAKKVGFEETAVTLVNDQKAVELVLK